MYANDLRIQSLADCNEAAVREQLRKIIDCVDGDGLYEALMCPLKHACDTGDFTMLDEGLSEDVSRMLRRIVANAAMVTTLRQIQVLKDEDHDKNHPQ